MKRTGWGMGLALAAGLSFWGIQAPGAKTETQALRIIASGNTLGELKPCGCAKEEDQGGIERRSGYLKKVRAHAKNTLLLDTGDNFKEPSRQGKLKAETLMRAMASMEYDAVTLGDHDLVYGHRFLLEKKGIPWTSANIRWGDSSLPPYRIKTFENGIKAAVVAVSDPDLFYGTRHSDLHIDDPRTAVESLLKPLKDRERPDLVVLLTHMNRAKALELLNLNGVDVVVNGHIQNPTDTIDLEPVRRKGKIFVQPGPRGQKLAEVKVHLNPGTRKTYHFQQVRMGSKVPEDPKMTRLYQAYNQEVEKMFFETLAARRENNSGTVYATETVCQSCHPQAHATWAASRHGHAYATLRKINKAFDPECIRCHVTGFNRKGGFISEVDTPELKNVQCEVCHGPGLQHTRSPGPGYGGNAREACQKCHVKNHSPRFQYSKYWPKIKH